MIPPTHHEHDGPHEDRWHYLDYRNLKHDSRFSEWKYFNFIQDGLAGYIVYYVLDPEKETRFGGGRLLVRLFKDKMPIRLIKHIDIGKIQFDATSASATFDKAAIIEKSSHHYTITCDFDEVSWELDYKQEIPSVESFNDVNSGLEKWEKWNWLIKMPRAAVAGIVRLGSESFSIQGRGYTDANWGKLLPFFTHYEWAQFNDAEFSLLFGVLYGVRKRKSAYVYFALGEHVVPLENSEVEIKHTTWTRDSGNGMKIPARSSFAADKNGYSIRFTTTLIASDSPGLKMNTMLPKTVISEQLVRYDGTVHKDRNLLHEFHGIGFKEWSTKTWRHVTVPF